MAEAEATINAYSKEISLRKSKLAQCDKKLDDLKEQQVIVFEITWISLSLNLH